MPNDRVGAPTKFTPETREKILYALGKGAPYEIACNYAGVSYNAFRKWILRAEDDKMPEFVEFLHKVKEVEGMAALRWLDKIDAAMDDGAWQSAAWKLERRHYKYFSNNAQAIEHEERLSKLEEKDVKNAETSATNQGE